MTDIFDVIADGTRRDILQLLLSEAANSGEGTSVSEIVDKLGISQPTVSKHLKVLRDAELVTVREDGQRRFYRLAVNPLGTVDDWLLQFLPSEAGHAEVAGDEVMASFRKPTPIPEGATQVAQAAGRAAATAKHAVQTALKKLGV
jgi:DNA-binding transcriptional ArsR family regulator